MTNLEFKNYIVKTLKERGFELNGCDDYILIDIHTLQPIDFKNLPNGLYSILCEKEGLQIVLTYKGFRLETTRSNQMVNATWLYNAHCMNNLVEHLNDKMKLDLE